ncbi:Ig-like domain-containing domain [Macellibacteroides fermentans]|uniref:Ig-like domain-containing domain n=1 Tax=Macellibacteroides fermentans TaxID=879969 RepID=UPI002B3769B7|nr:Ig-like domain-containing domain [Macellibacteroides fermentans]
MNPQFIRNSILALIGIFLLVVMYSCANMASPNGGPYDEKPPRFIASNPLPNQTNFKGNKVEIEFDELIQIENPMENVIVTPPQRMLPVIQARGRKAVVELKDTLKPNTTYTIDFTNSIADNNEKNVFENFSFAFSTGNVIDSLEVSGTLLNAENLEPMPGITIGLHSNQVDSAFRKLPFERISRTNDKGKFTIRNIATGSYHIFGLNDINRDYRFDQPGEEMAFADSLYTPTFQFTSRNDTVWKDSITVDSIKVVNYTRFMPDDVLLLLSKEKFERQYLTKSERTQDNRFTIRFNAQIDSIPAPRLLQTEAVQDKWYVAQKAEENKAVHYWLTDSLLWKQDTIRVALDYLKSDSLNVLRPQTDTLQMVLRKRPEVKKKRKKGEPEPIVFLGMNVDAPSSMDVFDTVSVVFDEPVLNIKKEAFYLDRKVDTLWQEVDFNFIPDSTNALGFFIDRDWKYGETYRLEADSATIYSLYGKWNNVLSTQFTIKKQDDYGNLYINLPGVDTTAFVQLLNASDQPVRKAPVREGGVLFMDLKPDKYYARIILDLNNNDEWDPGNFAEKRQPEPVYYYPGFFTVMQNFDVEETWDVTATPLIRQKPLEITKNKPKEATKKKRDYKNEGRQSSSGNNSMPGMPF